MKITKGMFVSAASSVVLGTLLIGSVTFAQTTPTTPTQGEGQGGWGRGGRMMGRMPGVFGTVASVNGTTLTITSKAGPNGTPAAATYTVDASGATVTKEGSASTVSSIATGDTVMVQGTVSGTSVTAKVIRDGMPGKGAGMEGRSQTPGVTVQGNGQPVIGGTVSTVSGTTLTVATAQGGISYSVDASAATVRKGAATSSVSSISVGDRVVVQGSVNGTSVTASSIIDQGTSDAAGTPESSENQGQEPRGIMGAVRGFFQHLFGFF